MLHLLKYMYDLISVALPFFKRSFLVNNATMFAVHDVLSTNGQLNKYTYRQISRSIIETFAVDAKSNLIYFVDSKNGSIKKHDIISEEESIVATTSSAKGKISRYFIKLLVYFIKCSYLLYIYDVIN